MIQIFVCVAFTLPNLIPVVPLRFVPTIIISVSTRKNDMIESLERELLLLNNKAKYIQENLNETFDLRKKKKEQVVFILK